MTDEIEMMRDQARRFIEREIAPQLERWRAQGRSDPAAWRHLGEMGLLLPELPEEFGGAGATLAHQMVIQDELARAEAVTGTLGSIRSPRTTSSTTAPTSRSSAGCRAWPAENCWRPSR